MNTKTEQISSGLVAVAWMEYTCDPLVRLSDAEATISDLQNLVIAENQRKQQLEAEVERLRQFEVAFTEWLEKSDFVQKDKDGLFYGWSLGLHRADAMQTLIKRQAERIKELETSPTMAAIREMIEAECVKSNAEYFAQMVKQSAALKLARGVIEIASDAYNLCWKSGMPIIDAEVCEALAAIDSLQGEVQ